jgi:replication factor A1
MSTAAADKPALRKPVFTKVDQLRPGTTGHTLTVKVVSATPVPGRARPGAPAPASSRAPRIAECLVGDDTGAIVFTARNEQGSPDLTDCAGPSLLIRCNAFSRELIVSSRGDYYIYTHRTEPKGPQGVAHHWAGKQSLLL